MPEKLPIEPNHTLMFVPFHKQGTSFTTHFFVVKNSGIGHKRKGSWPKKFRNSSALSGLLSSPVHDESRHDKSLPPATSVWPLK